MRRTFVLSSLFITTVSLVFAVNATSPSTAASQEGPTLRVLAGLGRGIVSANEYTGDPAFPVSGTVRVAEGTTVIWALGSDEVHTVTFRAGRPWPSVFMAQPEDPTRPPMLNPELLFPTVPAGPWDGMSFIHKELNVPGDDLRVTFARQGTFRYSCLFHEEMDGYVEVVAPGSAGITTQDIVDRFAATHLDEEHAEYNTRMIASRSIPERAVGPDGSTTWFMRAGTNERRGHVDINGFLPEMLTVSTGDTVVWFVDHSAPHTVTFPAAGGPSPEFVALQLPDGRLIAPPAPNEPPAP